MAGERRICVGMIAGAHGIRGHVRLRSFMAEPEDIALYHPVTDEKGGQVFDITIHKAMKDFFVAEVDGVKDRNAAEALGGTRLYVAREILPEAGEGQYYQADLVGLAAVDGSGKSYGQVMAVHDYGAGVFLEIGSNKKDSFMLPFKDAQVPEVDLATGRVVIAVPDGWLDKSRPSDDGDRA